MMGARAVTMIPVNNKEEPTGYNGENISGPDVSIIIANWNLKDYLRSCLASLYESSGTVEIEAIVVDNASTDGSVEMVEAEFGQVKLLRNEENVGFSKANNLAMDIARGRYIFLLNNDTLLYEHSLSRLVRFMDDHADAGVCGPRIINEDGSLQVRSKGRYPSISTALGQFLLPASWRHRGLRPLGFYEHQDNMTSRQIDWVSGCALMVRREALDTVGFLDSEVFMYCEDVDWCYRMRKAGWKVVYNPHSVVLHYGGKSMKKQTGRVVGAHKAGLVAFYGKYHGAGSTAVFRSVLWTGYALQAAGWLLDAVRGRRSGIDKFKRMLFKGKRGSGQ